MLDNALGIGNNHTGIKKLQQEIDMLVEKESERLFQLVVSQSKSVNDLYFNISEEQLEKIITFDKVKEYEFYHITTGNIRDKVHSFVSKMEIKTTPAATEVGIKNIRSLNKNDLINSTNMDIALKVFFLIDSDQKFLDDFMRIGDYIKSIAANKKWWREDV